MQLIPIKPTEAFALTAEERQSFASPPAPYRISGPPGLARLVMRREGVLSLGRSSYWFSEKVFSDARNRGKAVFSAQNLPPRGPSEPSLKELVALYMKFCFRGDLAISKNWTPNFDGYAVIPLRPVDSLVAWVGQIKNQPYFNKPDRARCKDEADYLVQLKLHQDAVTGGNILTTTEKQYVVDLKFPANQGFAQRVLGPYEF